MIAPTPSGNAEIELRADSCFTLPRLNISIEGPATAIADIANRFIRGEMTPEQVGALAEISKLHRGYHPTLLEKFEADPGTTAGEARALARLENTGYQYFPTKKQLLVRDKENFQGSYPVVSFIDERRAKCRKIWGSGDIAKKFASWVTMGQINHFHTYTCLPDMTPAEAKLIEKGILKLGLPYGKVGRTIRLISGYSAGHRQHEMFNKLEQGLTDREVHNLEDTIKGKKTDAAREERYGKAQEFSFCYLEDTKELLLKSQLLVDLSDDPPTLYEVESPYANEIGRYVVRRKWGKHAEIKRKDIGKLRDWQLNDTLERVETAIEKAEPITGPYRERLNSFYHSLLAHTIKK